MKILIGIGIVFLVFLFILTVFFFIVRNMFSNLDFDDPLNDLDNNEFYSDIYKKNL